MQVFLTTIQVIDFFVEDDINREINHAIHSAYSAVGTA